MLKKLYDKSNILFAILWIVAYCVLMSLGDALSAMVGVEKSVTVVVGFLLSAVLWLFLKKNGLLESYGFCAPRASARTMLYYLPVLAMLTANFWFGVAWNYGIVETVLYVLAMLCVGFLEEVIFRGLLFEAMRKDNLKAAVIVSAVTFGIGHIINLINGSGVELLPNLLQVVYATAAGFMFVMLYCKTKSLVGCDHSRRFQCPQHIRKRSAHDAPEADPVRCSSYAHYWRLCALSCAFHEKGSESLGGLK